MGCIHRESEGGERAVECDDSDPLTMKQLCKVIH